MERFSSGSELSVTIKEFIADLERDARFSDDIVHHEVIKGNRAQTTLPDPPLSPGITAALAQEGIETLYSHQAEGLSLVREGRNVVAVTPTASGKTLVYLLPLFERIIAEPRTRALLLFPLKALAQDQLKRIREFSARIEGTSPSAEIYDGDTPHSRRAKIRQHPPNLLLTNPDMLHMGLLPYHTQWETFFRDLKYVVIDELHGYKGIFGSHVLQVIRRLRRIALFHHASPQFIATSATIANPGTLAGHLTGLPFEVVERNGAPSSQRHVIFYNPAASLYTAAVRLLAEAVNNGLKTIVFTKARRITELIHNWTLQSEPGLAGRISAYRAGYLPGERREIEGKLRSGELDGVITTSALEMGIDIGGLDVCILVGYPGTIATTWQRGGRVGRKGRDSAIFMLALPDALDQYFMRHPRDFFRRDVEAAVVDEANPYLLSSHLVCAAAEDPLKQDDTIYPPDKHAGIIAELVAEGELLEAAGGFSWFSKEKLPQRKINIRGTGASFGIYDETNKKLVGKVSAWQARAECHPGAVYLHHGQTYLVSRLDTGSEEAWVRRATVAYYTQAHMEKQTEILEVNQCRELERYKVSLGRLRVTEWIVGYEKRSTATREKISEHPLEELPPVIYETIGLWIEPPASAIAGLAYEKRHVMGSLHSLEHASLALLPIFALCDRNDVGGISFTRHQQTGGAAVFLYDGYPGGIGLAARTYEVLPELLDKILDLVRECECEDGCPSCIHSPKCGHGNNPLDKPGVIRLLEHLTGGHELSGDPALTKDRHGDESPPGLRKVRPGALKPSTGDDAGAESEPPAAKPHANLLPVVEGHDIVIFDLETRLSAEEVGGWHNAHMMRIALGVIFERKTGDFHTFFEENVHELIEKLRSAELVIGFNNKRFDYAVLRGYTNLDFRALPSIDLLDEFFQTHGFRIGLGDFGAGTLGAEKTADGLTSLQWWKEGKIKKIEEYCRADVDLTAKLFDFALEHGYLVADRLNQGLVRFPLELPVEKLLGRPTSI